MLTITPFKTGLYQQKPVIAKVNKIQNYPAYNNMTGNICYPPVYFTGIINKTERPPFKDSTVEKLDNVFENYKLQLDETSIDDINASVETLENSTAFSQKDILKGMQQLTQFGNIRSLNNIGNVLEENEIGVIPNNGIMFKAYISGTPLKTVFQNNTGQNASFEYLFLKKDLHTLDGGKLGIFLDKNKLDDLEEFKKNNPEKFEQIKHKKNIKFFVVSGLENGISFLDRTKDLTKETKKLLDKSKKYNISIEEAIDKETLERADKLGIKPIIIKNKTPATIDNIYNQLRPEQFSKNELKAVLDATVMKRFEKPNDRIECKDGLASYLENKLEVYTPERLSKELKIMHSNIKKTVKSLGKTMDDVIYIIPSSQKSYDLIGYQYQLINNIPREKFITLENEKSINKLDLKNKALVFLDDCSLSGSSLLEDENFKYSNMGYLLKNNNANIIFSPLYASQNAEERLERAIIRRNRKDKDFILKNNKDEKNWDDNIEDVKTKLFVKESLGDMGWNGSGYCIIFPYMTPDNNSELASNIALFHNINYRQDSENFNDRIFTLTNIKTFHEIPRQISHLTNKLLKEE